MPVKVNYNVYGYVLKTNFKKFYLEFLNWKINNSFYDDGQITPNHMTHDANYLFSSLYYDIALNQITFLTDMGRQTCPIILGRWDG